MRERERERERERLHIHIIYISRACTHARTHIPMDVPKFQEHFNGMICPILPVDRICYKENSFLMLSLVDCQKCICH